MSPRYAVLRSLRFRIPATAMAVFAISLAVASVLAYELLLQDGRRDINVVIAREQQRFERSMTELLAEAGENDPDASATEALRAAVRRYLQLNPSTASYWTIVRFEEGPPLAAANGPPQLEPLYRSGQLPEGPLGLRQTLYTAAGDIQTSSVPIRFGDETVATLQIVSPLAPVREEARQAAWLVAAAAGLSLLLGGVLLTASLWRSLTPLQALAATARTTELRSFGARVEVPDTEDEVGQLATEFNTMLDRLDAASAAQDTFMASIGHELRTPITIARGHLEVLRTTDRADPVALEDTIAIVQDELQRMGRLVDDLMAIARAGMDDLVRPRELDLVGWFEELEVKLAGLDRLGQVRIEPPPPVELRADPDRLAQAVLNLITNAQQHTPPGTTIRISAATERGWVVLAVSDDGPGIPPAIRDEVFEPFVRAGEVPTSTGLGLTVVRAVVDAHGGEIVLGSDDHGTRVELRLPWHGHTAGAIWSDAHGWTDEPGAVEGPVPADDDTMELVVPTSAESQPTLRPRRRR
jgi:two-component system, OmpR family, sensor kinase